MNKYDKINFYETDIDLESMQTQSNKKQCIKGPLLADELIKKIKEQSETQKEGIGLGASTYFFGPSPADFKSFHSYWRIELLSSIDKSILSRIDESEYDEEVIQNELGITKEEFIKANPIVLKKAKKYLSESKNSMKRR